MNSALLRAAHPLWPPPIQTGLPFDPTFFDTLPLYDFQVDMLWKLVEAIEAGYRRILLQLPTGGGKTFLATAILGGADSAQFIVHRKELLEQTSKAFWRAGIAHSFIAANMPMDLDAAVLLAGVKTLANRLGVILPPEIAIIDEGHHSTAKTWADIIDAWDDTVFVALSATPERLDGRGLDEFYEIMIRGPTEAELIARGFLSPFDYYAPSRPDFSGVRTIAGDWDKGGAEAVMNQPTLIGDMVEHYLRLARGKPGIVFASSREHSRNLVDAYRAEGVRAIHVDGSMSADERTRADAMMRAGDVDIMSNVDLFGEGYDVPGIVYLGLGRSSQSRALIKQWWGRDLRAVYAPGMPLVTDADRLAAIAAGPKPRAIICDHGNNWANIGMLPDWDYDWTLAGRDRKSSGQSVNDDADPVHQCLTCYRVTPSVVRVCPGCGTEFPVQVRTLKQGAGTLTKLEREEAKRIAAEQKRQAAFARKLEEWHCKSENDFYELAVRRGFDNPRGWAKLKVKLKANGGKR